MTRCIWVRKVKALDNGRDVNVCKRIGGMMDGCLWSHVAYAGRK